MTVVYVDVHHTVHTCPGNPEPHIIDTRQTIIGVASGGPCREPAIIRQCGIEYTRPCRDVRAEAGQCPACRRIVWTHNTTVTDVGFQHTPATSAGDTGTVPCPVCHSPVARYLGAHLLCIPRTRGRA